MPGTDGFYGEFFLKSIENRDIKQSLALGEGNTKSISVVHYND